MQINEQGLFISTAYRYPHSLIKRLPSMFLSINIRLVLTDANPCSLEFIDGGLDEEKGC